MLDGNGGPLASGKDRNNGNGGKSSSRPGPGLNQLALTGLLLCACTVGDGSDEEDWYSGAGTAIGDELATLETEVGRSPHLLIHGTLPLPPRAFPLRDSTHPFRIEAPDGTRTPVQVDSLSRYGRGSDGSDVVEVSARVRRPAGLVEGARASFRLVYDPRMPLPHNPQPAVTELLGTPGAMKLTSSDWFGHEYERDLSTLGAAQGTAQGTADSPGTRKLMRDGEVVRTERSHSSLVPVESDAGPTGTLPHLMGVHAYTSTFQGEDWFALDLAVHNGHSGHRGAAGDDDPTGLGDEQAPGADDGRGDPDNAPAGRLYFRDLVLELPAGWSILSAFDDPLLGDPVTENGRTRVPLVSALPENKMHLMPRQARFHRRLAIAPAGAEEAAREYLDGIGLAFASPGTRAQGGQRFSWRNLETARFFPQCQPLPSLTHLDHAVLRADLAAERDDLMAHLAAGTSGDFPLVSPALGWAHPWGVPYGGMTGSGEIHMVEGVPTAAASRAGYAVLQLMHRMVSERHPTALFDGDGEPTRLAHWVEGDSAQGEAHHVKMRFSIVPDLTNGDPFGFTTAPTFQVEAVENAGAGPDYAADLLGYKNIDLQHLVRHTKNAKALVWLGADPLARDEVRLQGELVRLSYHQLPNDENGYVQSSGQLADRQYADQHPSTGVLMGRGEGWAVDAMVGAYRLGDNAWRAEATDWFDKILELMEDGQSNCLGYIHNKPGTGQLDNQYRVRQNFEESILALGLRSMTESVWRGRDGDRVRRAEALLTDALYAMVGPDFWDSAAGAPYHHVGVADNTPEAPPFCTDFGPLPHSTSYDRSQCWGALAQGYILTEDELFLQRAMEMLGNNDLLSGLESDGLENLTNRSPLLALAQERAR
ncbi:MAG: hypothetical protein QF411_11820 [Planctomycetota bacterium]|nr:hypothetical protein [Planctomycetota bacterium]